MAEPLDSFYGRGDPYRLAYGRAYNLNRAPASPVSGSEGLFGAEDILGSLKEVPNMIGDIGSAFDNMIPGTQASGLSPLPDTRGLVLKAMEDLKQKQGAPVVAPPGPYHVAPHEPQPGQTSFTNADLQWEHEHGPAGLGAGFGSAFGKTFHAGGGGYGTFEPGPGSDYYEEKQQRETRDAGLAAAKARATYEASMYAPAQPGQAFPELGMEAQQRQQRTAADAALDAKMVEIYGTGGYGQGGSLEAALARHDIDFPGANHHSDPTGQRIRDSNARAAYVQGIAAIREAADRAFSLAKLRYESQLGGRGFEAAFQGATGRAAAKDIEGGYGLR